MNDSLLIWYFLPGLNGHIRNDFLLIWSFIWFEWPYNKCLFVNVVVLPALYCDIEKDPLSV